MLVPVALLGAFVALAVQCIVFIKQLQGISCPMLIGVGLPTIVSMVGI